MMERARINTDSLNTISECLEQLALAEQSVIAIDGQLLKQQTDPEWRQRAEVARRTIQQKKRIVMSRLAVLRQQEKELNVLNHQQHNDYLIMEFRKIVTPSSFIRCAQRATEKMEAEQ